jgi:hypothetical protein
MAYKAQWNITPYGNKRSKVTCAVTTYSDKEPYSPYTGTGATLSLTLIADGPTHGLADSLNEVFYSLTNEIHEKGREQEKATPE